MDGDKVGRDKVTGIAARTSRDHPKTGGSSHATCDLERAHETSGLPSPACNVHERSLSVSQFLSPTNTANPNARRSAVRRALRRSDFGWTSVAQRSDSGADWLPDSRHTSCETTGLRVAVGFLPCNCRLWYCGDSRLSARGKVADSRRAFTIQHTTVQLYMSSIDDEQSDSRQRTHSHTIPSTRLAWPPGPNKAHASLFHSDGPHPQPHLALAGQGVS